MCRSIITLSYRRFTHGSQPFRFITGGQLIDKIIQEGSGHEAGEVISRKVDAVIGHAGLGVVIRANFFRALP